MQYKRTAVSTGESVVLRFTLFHSYIFENEQYTLKEKTSKATLLIAEWNEKARGHYIYEVHNGSSNSQQHSTTDKPKSRLRTNQKAVILEAGDGVVGRKVRVQRAKTTT